MSTPVQAGGTFALPDPAATEALGRRLAAALPPQPVVAYLEGDLGAGKSTLARALLRALGVTGTIRSPTYTLVEPYVLADGREALHLDLYRIADPAELDYLGLEPGLARLWLVEWPRRGQGLLPPADLAIALELAGDGRCARLQAHSAAGRAWLGALQAAAGDGEGAGG